MIKKEQDVVPPPSPLLFRTFLVNKLFGFVVDPDLHGRKSRNSFSRPNFHLGKFNSAVVTFDTKTGLHNF